MSKEEILENKINNSGFVVAPFTDNQKEIALDAMSIHAKQQSIAFAKWKDENGYTLLWIGQENIGWGLLNKDEVYSDTEIYQLFLKTKTND